MNAATATGKHTPMHRSVVDTGAGSVTIAAMLGSVIVHREGMSLTPRAARMLAAELMRAAPVAEQQEAA